VFLEADISSGSASKITPQAVKAVIGDWGLMKRYGSSSKKDIPLSFINMANADDASNESKNEKNTMANPLVEAAAAAAASSSPDAQMQMMRLYANSIEWMSNRKFPETAITTAAAESKSSSSGSRVVAVKPQQQPSRFEDSDGGDDDNDDEKGGDDTNRSGRERSRRQQRILAPPQNQKGSSTSSCCRNNGDYSRSNITMTAKMPSSSSSSSSSSSGVINSKRQDRDNQCYEGEEKKNNCKTGSGLREGEGRGKRYTSMPRTATMEKHRNNLRFLPKKSSYHNVNVDDFYRGIGKHICRRRPLALLYLSFHWITKHSSMLHFLPISGPSKRQKIYYHVF